MKQLGQYAAPRHAIAHLSDPHLIGGGRLHYGVIDNIANLRRALDRLAAVQPPPQALVFTGDLADRAEPEAYATLRGIVEPAAEAMGAIVVWTMGNHDERAAYAAGLYDSDEDGAQDRVHEVDGLRIVALDTSVPGYHHGALRPEQLAWLADVLTETAPHGTLLALHHPPVPTPSPLMSILELREQSRLAEVVAGSDIRAILGGHMHSATTGMFAGIPVSVAAATCYTIDPTAPRRELAGVDGGQSFNLVRVHEDQIVHSHVPVGLFDVVTRFDTDFLDRFTKLTAEERTEAFSRHA